MVRWPSVREGFYDRLSILSIKNTKIFNRWIDNVDENETKSIDRYYRYRSIDPSPIVPIYVFGVRQKRRLAVERHLMEQEKHDSKPEAAEMFGLL